jgi:hypothetical protein
MQAHCLTHVESQRKVGPAPLDVEFFLRFEDLTCEKISHIDDWKLTPIKSACTFSREGSTII